MSNVYTTMIGVPKIARNKRIYGDGGSFSNSVVQSNVNNDSIVTPKDVITFTALEIPILIDYQTNYAAAHGEYPLVRCIIDVDATNGYELQQMPQFTYIAGLIDTIYFLPGYEVSGKIILQ